MTKVSKAEKTLPLNELVIESVQLFRDTQLRVPGVPTGISGTLLAKNPSAPHDVYEMAFISDHSILVQRGPHMFVIPLSACTVKVSFPEPEKDDV